MVENSILWIEHFTNFNLSSLHYFVHKLLRPKQRTSQFGLNFYKYSNSLLIVQGFSLVAVVGCAYPAVE